MLPTFSKITHTKTFFGVSPVQVESLLFFSAAVLVCGEMDPQMWQQLQQQQGRGAAVPPASVPVGDVPMKGVILANRKMIFHKTRVCPRLSSGACHLGSKCNFAHSVEELRPPPNLDKTKLCPSVLQPGTVCPAEARGEICRFAHSKVEIRHTSNMFKTNMCLKWIRGKCKVGAAPHFRIWGVVFIVGFFCLMV